MVMLRGSLNNYQLSAHDEDLQDNPPCSAQMARLAGKEATARQRAIVRLNTASGLNVTLQDFEVTQTAAGDTSRFTPVEWRHTVTAGHGNHARTWTMIVDMDSVAPGQPGNGPDRSHVGYSYWCVGYNPIARVNGHIFVEYVSASR